VSAVLENKTLGDHRKRADAIYASRIDESPSASIGRLGGVTEHSAELLEQTFGSAASVIEFASDQQTLLASSIAQREASCISRFVARNKVV
jgi:hypothetical protein